MSRPLLSTPYYEKSWRKVHVFDDLHYNRAHFFIELEYLINRGAEVTRTTGDISTAPTLTRDMLSGDGELIFDDVPTGDGDFISNRDYRLIKDSARPENEDEDLIRVTELYGYAPGGVFYGTANDGVERWPTEDPDGYVEKSCATSGSVYALATKEFGINMVANASFFRVGDEVRLYGVGSGSYYDFVCPPVKINRKEANKIYVNTFSGVFTTSTTEYGGQDVINILNRINPSFWSGTLFLIRDLIKVPKKTIKVNLRTETTYSIEIPAEELAFVPTNEGGVEVDSITQYTTPTISAWKASVAAREYYLYEDALIEEAWPGIWRKVRKLAPCR